MSSKTFGKIVFWGFLVIGTIAISRHEIKKSELYKNGSITSGKIIGTKSIGKTGRGIEYHYIVNGIFYSKISKITILPMCREQAINIIKKLKKYDFEVLYDPKNPELSDLLLLKSQYLRFQRQEPPVLTEIIAELSECEN